jgi:formylglycine-generating enzyme required for sulfatase activity
MARVQALLEALGSALCGPGRECLSGARPLGDCLTEVAREAVAHATRQLPADELRVGLGELADVSPADYTGRLDRLVAGLRQTHAGIDPGPLAEYLRAWPATVRSVLRRPSDPHGCTAPESLEFRKPDDFLLFLPPRLPGFHAGDAPARLDDWTLARFRGMGECTEVWEGESRQHAEHSPAALKFVTDPAAAAALGTHQSLLREVFELNDLGGVVPLRRAYLDADVPCLEYGFVSGYDLTALIHDWRWRYTVPKPDAALKLMKRLADIVGQAHARGVVHRDLKPSNVLVHPTDGGRFTLWVSDWGWGQVQAARSLELGRGGTPRAEQHRLALRGAHTPLYACPQMARKEPPAPTDDVHALGVLWFQLLKRDPHAAAPVGTDWADEFKPHGLTDSQARLLASCVATRPDRRPRTAEELSHQLANVSAAVAAGGPGSARMAAVGSSGSSATLPALGTKAASGPASASLLVATGTVKLGKGLGLAREAENGTGLTLSGREERLVAHTDAATGWGGLPRMVTNGIGMVFVLCPPGEFVRGSPESEAGRRDHEGPARPVKITRPFYLAATPVTQAQFEKVVGRNPSHFRGHPDHPVETIGWQGAERYAQKLGELTTEVIHGRKYRLPTEAEWEYGCRAGTTTAFCFGDRLTAAHAHYSGAKGPFVGKTCPVGTHLANPWGLYDLHGNVQEWVHDWYDEYYYQDAVTDDPTGPAYGSLRAVRGGCWATPASDCRSAARRGHAPDAPADTVGFRLVLTVGGTG